MCGLCGIFGVENHWTTGVQTEVSADPIMRRHARARRIRAVNRLLKNKGFQLNDWQAVQYILSNQTGKSVIVDNVTEVWRAMEIEFNQVFDPLNSTEISRYLENGDD